MERRGLLCNLHNSFGTLLLWGFFLFGFLILFFPFYLVSWFRFSRREKLFQGLNHRFFHIFFALLQAISRVEISIDEKIRRLDSSVVVCNHLSYLDPILLLSLFKKQKTITRHDFFRVPFFGTLIHGSGYIPSRMDGMMKKSVRKSVESLDRFFQEGGILFIFPEGTRSRDGSIAPFNEGAFKLARRSGVPIHILHISGSGEVFSPGTFFLTLCRPRRIELEYVETLNPGQGNKRSSPDELAEKSKKILEEYRSERQKEKNEPASNS